MNIFAVIMLTVVMMFTGCSDIILPEPRHQLVVEGWAEVGKPPVVIVTQPVPVESEYNSLSDLKDFVVRWAKVTITDGDTETVLSGRIDRNHFPAFIYSKDTYRIQAGKTYAIKVQYKGMSATSSVTVPHTHPLEYLRVERVDAGKDTYRIMAGVKDNPLKEDHYKFFVRREKKDSAYMSSFLGYIDDSSFASEVEEIAIHNAVSVMSDSFDLYFGPNDTVYVKFSVLDTDTWMYWSDFEELTSLSRNPMFPVSSKIRTNIDGGLGYWSGYGSSFYKVSIADSLAMGRVY